MWEELARLGAELSPDETLRSLVVTGEGPAFSAGIDLVEGMAGMLADWAARLHDEQALGAGRAAAITEPAPEPSPRTTGKRPAAR